MDTPRIPPSSGGERERFNPGLLTDLTTRFYRCQFSNASTTFYHDNGTAASNVQDVPLNIALDESFWILGAQLLVEMPSFLRMGMLRAYLSKSYIPPAANFSVASVNPIAIVTGGRDFIMLGQASVGLGASGEVYGSPMKMSYFSPPAGAGVLMRTGDVLCLFAQYDYIAQFTELPSPDVSNVFLHLILYTVPYANQVRPPQ